MSCKLIPASPMALNAHTMMAVIWLTQWPTVSIVAMVANRLNMRHLTINNDFTLYSHSNYWTLVLNEDLLLHHWRTLLLIGLLRILLKLLLRELRGIKLLLIIFRHIFRTKMNPSSWITQIVEFKLLSHTSRPTKELELNSSTTDHFIHHLIFVSYFNIYFVMKIEDWDLHKLKGPSWVSTTFETNCGSPFLHIDFY